MQRAQKDLRLTYGTPNCLNYFGPRFSRLLHVRKRRWKWRAGQNKHPIYQGRGAGEGKRAAPEHQSTRTVPTARPREPSDGNYYQVLASFPQMWQHSRGRSGEGRRWELEEKGHCLLPKKIQLTHFPSPLASLKRLPCPEQGTIC